MKSAFTFRKISTTFIVLVYVTGFGLGIFDAAKSKQNPTHCRPAAAATKQ